MPIKFGAPELMILLAIFFLLFGVGRISKVAEELGKGIHTFRNAIRGQEKGGTSGEDR